MNTLINLLKDSQIGTWCKRGAWVILVIGLFEVVANVSFLPLQSGFGLSSGLNEWLNVLRLGLSPLPSILFYFFILYAAGAVVNHFVRDGEDESEDEEDKEDMLIEEEGDDITPGQFTEGSSE